MEERRRRTDPQYSNRLDKIDEKLDQYEEKCKGFNVLIDNLQGRAERLEGQLNRINSHLESEMGLARRDLLRIEERLFGKGDTEFTGAIGEIRRKLRKNDQLMWSVIGGGIVIMWLVEHVPRYFYK